MQSQDDSASNSVDSTSSSLTVKVDKVETPKKPDKKDDVEDPKPRIVLTFRSEKSGAKSSNMKIVTPEEKQEEVSPRRSGRTRHSKAETFDDTELSKKDKSQSSQPVSESDETSDSSHAPKRSTPRRSKEFTDVLSTAIARKEKHNETAPTPTQRLSRRIKPTAKILANEELRIGLESQNNARLGIQPEKSEEGVCTRRSGQPKTAETVPDKKTARRKGQEDKEEVLEGAPQGDSAVMKLKHLCELGLKAIGKSTDEDSSEDNENSDAEEDEGEDEEIDDDTEIINKLLEADEEWEGESSDDDYLVSEDNSQSDRPRRSRRLCSGYGANDSDHSSPVPVEGKSKSRPRRSSRRTLARVSYEYTPDGEFDSESLDREFAPKRKKNRMFDQDEDKLEMEDDEIRDFVPKRKKTRAFDPDEDKLENAEDETRDYPNKRKKTRSFKSDGTKAEMDEDNSNPAEAEEGAEAAGPSAAAAITGACLCEAPSNVYAEPSDLIEPVFCQAIEMVDGIRAGCSHPARREVGGKALAPLLRAGPRAPYFLACALHTAQLEKHMCCPTCGLFCTQGIFYQCSVGHLFHAECGVLGGGEAVRPGCPHCGVATLRWAPANRDTHRVQLLMHCSNERVLLPAQRVQCTPAFLGFSTIDKSKVDAGPVIPEGVLPSVPIDLKKICEEADTADGEEEDGDPVERLYDAIVSGETVEQLIPKIVRGSRLNASLASRGGDACVHGAAARGRAGALLLLQYAGAALDAADALCRTPLMRATLALLKQDETLESAEKKDDEDDVDIDGEDKPDKETETDGKESEGDKEADDSDKETEDSTMETEKSETEVVEAETEKDCDKPTEKDLMSVIRYLVDAGCDLNFSGPEGMTALHIAAQYGGVEVCTVLLDGGADVDARDHGGWTPLVWASENFKTDVVRLLLSRGADACAADGEGGAAAHWAALAGAAASLRALLAAAPHAASQADARADTPLHIAAREGHYSCVVLLLARDARTDMENLAGELPVEVCSGQCQAAISLNMQMKLAVKEKFARRRLLDVDISRGREPFPVECVNEVDDEPLPPFTYVSQHVMPENVNIDYTLQSLQGCSCSEGACAGGCCGCGALGVRRWYRAGRLPRDFPFHDPPMLFECNQTCACDLKRCTNHVVSGIESRGSLGVRVCVFRTARRGWGLRAAERVPRGAAVALYCGELLPRAAADARENDHYMFALDVKPDLLDQCMEKTQLCVDAARLGSCARFVNHSCRPNLAPVRVFTATRDLRRPVVALFAVRDVPAGEELTFDYGDKFWAVKSKWMKCECEAPDCRYPTKSNKEEE